MDGLADAVHDFTTICAPVPLQHAAVAALQLPEEYYSKQMQDYHERREIMVETLRTTGFEGGSPEGAYYILASYDAWGFDRQTEDFARWLTREAGVAVVDGSSFYDTPGFGRGLVRFAFAKKVETLLTARERLAAAFSRR